MHRITVMNMKGGCGKTTVAINMAASYAHRGYVTSLTDHDPQGSSMDWLSRRIKHEERPQIHGIDARNREILTVKYRQLVPPVGTQVSIIDSPAGVSFDRITLRKLVEGTDTIVIPVLPSPIDIHACAHFIEALLVYGHAKTKGVKIGIVANRVRQNTIAFEMLKKFLNRLDIPFIATFGATQNYIHANELGLGVCELPKARRVKDLEEWENLTDWLNNKHMALEMRKADY